MAQHPKSFNALQTIMTFIQSADWLKNLDVLDQAVAVAAKDPERIFFVDVGGGHGHQCLQLLEKLPHLHGRVVLQDQAQAIDKLPPIKGVNAMAQDFFQDQTVIGSLSQLLSFHVPLTPGFSSVLIKIPKALSSTISGASYMTGLTSTA